MGLKINNQKLRFLGTETGVAAWFSKDIERPVHRMQ